MEKKASAAAAAAPAHALRILLRAKRHATRFFDARSGEAPAPWLKKQIASKSEAISEASNESTAVAVAVAAAAAAAALLIVCSLFRNGLCAHICRARNEQKHKRRIASGFYE